MLTAILLLAAIQTANAQPDRFGLPACSGPTNELAHRAAFTLCYSATHKAPLWTIYEITPERLHGSAPRPKRFRHDPTLAVPSASDADFRNSGYSRGHMVPAADMAFDEAALHDAFLLSNALPQNASLNQGKWRALENAVRRIAASADSVVVLSGPIFCPDSPRIGPNQLAVPCYFFKAILTTRGQQHDAFAAILPNADNPSDALPHFAVSICEVESRTGLNFFDALPQSVQDALESTARPIPSRN